MWRSLSASRGGSGGIVDFGVAYDGIAKVLTERGRGVQVDTAAKQCRQLVLDGDERIAGHVVRFELDKHVDIAVRAKVIAQHRSEQGKPPDVMPLTERSKGCIVNGNPASHWQR